MATQLNKIETRYYQACLNWYAARKMKVNEVMHSELKKRLKTKEFRQKLRTIPGWAVYMRKARVYIRRASRV